MIRGLNGNINDIADTDLAILSVGSIEQHGSHLPVITDWAIADAMESGWRKRQAVFISPRCLSAPTRRCAVSAVQWA